MNTLGRSLRTRFAIVNLSVPLVVSLTMDSAWRWSGVPLVAVALWILAALPARAYRTLTAALIGTTINLSLTSWSFWSVRSSDASNRVFGALLIVYVVAAAMWAIWFIERLMIWVRRYRMQRAGLNPGRQLQV